MSKSKGNVIDPLDVINDGYGADTLRTYEMFIGPYDQDAAWNPRSVGGVYRFLNRCWTLVFGDVAGVSGEIVSSPSASAGYGRGSAGATPATAGGRDLRPTERAIDRKRAMHRVIKKVTDDIERAAFNTAISSLMEYVNELYKAGSTEEDLITLGKLLKPFAPHLASEMLEQLGADDAWPTYDEKYLVEDLIELVVQVNGKLRAKLSVPAEVLDDENEVIKLASSDSNVQKFTNNHIKKTIYIKKAKLINLVV